MSAALGGKQLFQFEFMKQHEDKIKQLKSVGSHLGLYVGLILYTAIGAWVSDLYMMHMYNC